MLHWLAHLLGTTNASGPWYLWWSGIVGDFGLLGVMGTTLRHRNCEVHGCWRLGRHGTAAGHTVCRRHHPDSTLTRTDVITAHHAAVRRQEVHDDAAVLTADAADRAVRIQPTDPQ